MASNYAPIPLRDIDAKSGHLIPTQSPSSSNHHAFNPPILSNVQRSVPGPIHSASSSNPSKFRAIVNHYSSIIENIIETISKPIKPHLNKLGRFLLVSTFLEDSLRFIKQYDQIEDYLIEDLEYSYWFTTAFSVLNIGVMIISSILIIFKRWSLFSVSALVLVIVSQGLVYDLATDSSFVCLNLSILGALLLALSDDLTTSSNSRRTMAGVPNISEDIAKKRQTYLQFIGRILLVVFFVGHAVYAFVRLSTKHFSIYNMSLAISSVISCILVSIGFKARWSALFLVMVTSVVNVMSNNWWSKHKDSVEKDFRRFDFFQALSVVGGMLLLINQGPGGISFDARRSQFFSSSIPPFENNVPTF